MTQSGQRRLAQWVFALGASLLLSGCASLADLGERVVLQPLGQVARAAGLAGPGQPAATPDRCTPGASLVNPAALAPGLGGTGAPTVVLQTPGGMGGTGDALRYPGGMGGTGQVAQSPGLGGTGIVGVVTGFSSICVNGEKVEYDPGTPVERDGTAVPQSALSVGQVVALQASGQGGTRLQASRIAMLDAAVGPLSAVDAASGRFELMGQAGTALEAGDLAGLKPGNWVRVSGHRLVSGEIRASRVAATEPGVAQVTGPLTAIDALAWRVGTTPVRPDAQARLAALVVDQEVTVSGTWDGTRLLARETRAHPTREALGAVSEVLLQGYVHDLQGSQLRLGFESLTLSHVLQVLGGQLSALRAGQPVLVRGRLDAQKRLVVDQLEFTQESRRGSGGRSGSDRSGSSSSSSGSDSSGQGRGRGRGRGRSGGD